VTRGETLAVVAATLVAIATALGVALPGGEEKWHFARGALDGDCANSGTNPDGSVQFMVPCPRSARSPDGRWTLVQTTPTGGEEEIYDVLVDDASGRRIGKVPDINDGMPFVLQWSPRRDWFLINHWQGSGLERPRVFEITSRGIVEHDRFLKIGEDMARRISPCLPQPKPWLWVTGTGLRWSKDGRRLAWVFNTRPDMCISDSDFQGSIPPDKQWKPFLMISDVESGKIVDGSVRLLPDAKWDFPTDGPYADF
jgi:hypothetical protein